MKKSVSRGEVHTSSSRVAAARSSPAGAREGGGGGTEESAGGSKGSSGGGAATGSKAAEQRVEKEKEREREREKEAGDAGSLFSNFSNASPAGTVVVADTLEMLRGFERAGFDQAQSEALVRTVLATVKDATHPLCTRADLDRHALLQQSDQRHFQHDLLSRHREVAAKSNHDIDKVTGEIEKLRAEMRYNAEKTSSSQKLDMNLERGRIRDELQAQDNKAAAMEIRLDREIQAMRTSIEAAKSDVIKYSIGAVMSMAAVGMSLMRLMM